LENDSSKGEYRQILKATSVFGGVQLFSIIIKIIRAKFIAVLLGATGMGIAALLNSTLQLISALTEFGLQTSAVKDVAAATASGNEERIGRTVAITRKLVLLTGLLGTIITLAFSSLLSHITFGNKEYTLAFILISVTLLFNHVASGQSVIMQGMRRIGLLARAGISGSVAGLLISIPLYYVWGIDGIVPAIIITAFVGLLISWYFSNKIPLQKVKIKFREAISEGSGMIGLGFMISISGLITLGAAQVVRIFISRYGGVADVGLYSAGFSIISVYVGLVFTAMSKDYYPNLSGVAHNNVLARRLINQQSEISILILAPILSVFIIFIHWIVIILYSKEFTAANGMIQYAALGIYFKAVSWSIAYFFLAKGASKLFFWNELLGNIYALAFNIAGYYFWGLDGMGISFLAGYAVYLLQVFIITRIKYSFSFYKEFYRIFIPQLIIGIVCLLIIKFMPHPWSYMTGGLLIIISVLISLHEMNKRIELAELWNEVKRKLIRKK
jgi:O-antigen/teichoic acid export membrane protein